jgi:hypothetical protein
MLTAGDRVLSTPELFICILLELPQQTLLVQAQLVSRTWRNVITSSTQIQQTLFFTPLPPLSKTRKPQQNPLLVPWFRHWFKDKEFKLNESPYRNDFKPTQGWHRYKDLWELEFPWALDAKTAYMRAEASWRKMLIVQPAVCDLRVVSQVGDWLGPESLAALHFEQGLRMGVLWDITMDELSRRRSSEFNVSWYRRPVHEESVGKRRSIDGVCMGCIAPQPQVGHFCAKIPAIERRDEAFDAGGRMRDHMINLVVSHKTIRRKPVKETHLLKSLGYEKVDLQFEDESWDLGI